MERVLTGVVPVEMLTELEPWRRAVWDRWVGQFAGGDVAQLSGWATLRAQVGYRPLYLLAHQDGQLLGGAQLLLRGLPLVGTVAYLPYGPLITPGPGRDTARVALCEALRGLRRRGVRALLVQPPAGAEDVSDELFGLGFRESDAGVAPSATLRVGLDRDEAELRAGLSRRLRTWTRQWDSRGVRVRIGGPADIAALAELSARTATYQGFSSFPASYLRLLYEVLEPAGHAVLFVAEIGGQPVAAELFTGCGGVLKSRITGLDRDHPEVARLHVSAAVIWAAIRWARTRGYDWFDFGGLQRGTATRLLAGEPFDRTSLPGPDQFKLSFGGQAYRYPPAVELITPAPVRHAYDLARHSRHGQRLVALAKTALRNGPPTTSPTNIGP